MTDGDTKVLTGKIQQIGDVKQFGKLFSQGIKLEGNWYNVVDFVKLAVEEKLRGFQANDPVRLTLVQKGEYWNIAVIEHIEELEIERTSETLPSEQINLDDIKVFEKCLEDATQLLVTKIHDNNPESIVKIAIELFRSRTGKEAYLSQKK